MGAQLAGIRNSSLVAPSFNALTKRGFPQEQALKFARGYVALSGHQPILSNRGRTLLDHANLFLDSDKSASIAGAANLFDELGPQLPTASDPKLFLFISPSANLSPKEKSELVRRFNGARPVQEDVSDYRILQIIQGCLSQCLICALDAPAKMIHMPYPMILAIAEEFIEPKTHFQFSFDSDTIYYRDLAFDADFGDAALELQKRGFAIYAQTHGWWERDQFAQGAAEKFYKNGLRFDRLSVHFFHHSILRNADDPVKLERNVELFIERFRRAVQLLKPREIGGRGIWELVYRTIYKKELHPKVFGTRYVDDLIRERILQGVDAGEIEIIPPFIHSEGKAVEALERFGITWENGTVHPPGESIIFRPWGEVQRINRYKLPSDDSDVPQFGTEKSLLGKIF